MNDDSQLKELELLYAAAMEKADEILDDCPDAWEFTLRSAHRQTYPIFCAVQKLRGGKAS